MMSNRILMAAVAAATLALGLLPGTALATKAAYTVSGQVSSPPVNQQITVNEQTYNIAAGSPAETEANEVVQGESVVLTLDGPPDASSTHVVAINETSSN